MNGTANNSIALNCTLSALLNCTEALLTNGTNNSTRIAEPRPPRRPAPSCDAPTLPANVGQIVFLVIILLVTFLGNFMVCLAVFLYRRMRSITNFFVVSLAVSDLLISLLSLPFRIDQTLHNDKWCNSLALCQTWFIVDITCVIASIWNLAVISIDRFIAIVHPFRYHTIMTNRNGALIFAFVWINSATWAFTSLLNWTRPGKQTYTLALGQCLKYDPIFYTAVAVAQFFLPLLIVLVMYGNVFRVAMNQARAVASQQTSNRRGRRGSINLIREVKAAKTLAVVVGAFFICWFPYFVITMISFWSKTLRTFSKKYPAAWLGVSFSFTYVLPVLNSTLNPIIYAVFNRDFRAAFKKIINRMFRGRCDPRTNDERTLASRTTACDTMVDPISRQKGYKTRFDVYDPSVETDPIGNIEKRKGSIANSDINAVIADTSGDKGTTVNQNSEKQGEHVI